MHRVPFVLRITVVGLVAAGCGGNGISSDGTGGQVGSGGASALLEDSGAGGSLGTGGGIGSGGAADAPISAGTGGGTGGAPVVTGTGGTPVVTGTGGASAKLDAGSGDDSGNGPDSGTGGSPGCDQDLSGTWDLFASSLGTGIVRGTLIVSKDGFSLTANDCQLTYNAKGSKSVTWKYTSYSGTTTRLITVQNTPAAANTGSVPLAVGGHWVLQSNTETCTVDVAAD